jgi:undecaprenyl diphosphate synthase
VKYLTLYAFSSENWNRPQREIDALMSLLQRFLEEKMNEMHQRGVRLETIGNVERLPAKCRRQLEAGKELTRNNTDLTLVLALSYGSREEITQAARELAREAAAGHLDPAEITPEHLARHLDTAAYPDPDLLIRTSGEFRISNFLLWQISYAEFFISPKFWPDFKKSDLLAAVAEYARRHRRFGGI